MTLTEPLRYRHVGEAIRGPQGQDMSVRAEVGLLSRNVRIFGSQDVAGTDSFGAHVQMLHIDEAHLRYVELTHVGQANQLGHYPIHFHHSGVVNDRVSVHGCAVHRSFNVM